ncbi:MAG TPA: hypothetical protein VOA87_18535 [Thermoanaerobaculia bacterium]|nr:hypothetical protein [Thermoanaerobaculia bacterium]
MPSRKAAPSRELRNQIVVAVLAATLGALFGLIGALLTERRKTAEDLERIRSEIILRIEERSAETAVVLGKMIVTADFALQGRASGSSQSEVASVSQKFKELHFQLQGTAWQWPWYIVEEARTHRLLGNPALEKLKNAAAAYIENLKKEVELAWTLHAFCIAPRPEPRRIADVKSELLRVQAGERESLEAMKTVLRQQ